MGISGCVVIFLFIVLTYICLDHFRVIFSSFFFYFYFIISGASIPASDPFRLTPLLLAKVKMDNLRQTRLALYQKEDGNDKEDQTMDQKGGERMMNSNAQQEYQDLQSVIFLFGFFTFVPHPRRPS